MSKTVVTLPRRLLVISQCSIDFANTQAPQTFMNIGLIEWKMVSQRSGKEYSSKEPAKCLSKHTRVSPCRYPEQRLEQHDTPTPTPRTKVALGLANLKVPKLECPRQEGCVTVSDDVRICGMCGHG